MSRTRRGRRFFGSVRADLFVPYEFVMRLPRSGEQLQIGSNSRSRFLLFLTDGLEFADTVCRKLADVSARPWGRSAGGAGDDVACVQRLYCGLWPTGVGGHETSLPRLERTSTQYCRRSRLRSGGIRNPRARWFKLHALLRRCSHVRRTAEIAAPPIRSRSHQERLSGT